MKSDNLLPQSPFGDLHRTGFGVRMERLADVRSAVVLRGKTLIANPNYPEAEMVRKISHLLAARLRP